MNYLLGGMLGDFIHGLVVCKYNYEKNNQKANLFISNFGDVFEKGLDFALYELKPILEKQSWFNSIKIYDGTHIDVDISSFRSSKHIYTTNWLNIFFKTYLPSEPIPSEYSWIEIEKDITFENSLVVNRSPKRSGNRMSADTSKKFLEISSLFQKKFFVCYEQHQYDEFEFKEEFEMVIVKNLYEFLKVINSAKLFIGNQSSPFAMASSMNTPRVLEILKEGDKIGIDGVHYLTDTEYYKNFSII